MGLTGLTGFLHRHRRIALDSSIFIYQLEANPRYVELTNHVFSWLEQADHSAVSSTITMTELLVHPYRNSDDRQVDEFYTLLSTFPNLAWVPTGLAIADTAAKVRAVHRLRTPDALQAATAIQSQATGLITNDGVFERVKEFEILVLDRLF
ncbi:MAG: PIN domain-containing protein [Bryobacteraceae bacterium]